MGSTRIPSLRARSRVAASLAAVGRPYAAPRWAPSITTGPTPARSMSASSGPTASIVARASMGSAGGGGGGGGKPGLVRPAPTGRDERVSTLGEGRADEELEVAQLVAAERERKQVLTLDPHVRPAADGRREPRDPLERRWTVYQSEPRQ